MPSTHTIRTILPKTRSIQPTHPSSTRAFATVSSAIPANPSVRSHGGLKDQDRIFQNAYMKHDHLLKGAQVELLAHIYSQIERTMEQHL
jgi:hypothetical protein